MQYPIYNHRELVGYASTAKQAAKTIRKLISVHASMTVNVWLRNDDMCDLLGMPKGFTYSISYSY